jgi:hypothetical protein
LSIIKALCWLDKSYSSLSYEVLYLSGRAVTPAAFRVCNLPWFLTRESHPLTAMASERLGQQDAEIGWEGGRYDYFLPRRSPSSANGSPFLQRGR